MRLCCASLSIFVAACCVEVHAQEPYVPESDGQVLVTLPKSLLANRDLMQKLRDRLLGDPDNPKLASSGARRYLAVAKRGGGPRFDGYARAAIIRWWEDDEAPAEILRVRAKLKENDHRYAEAVEDLRLALIQNPEDSDFT